MAKTKGKIEHVLALQIIESWETTIPCHAQDYIFYIFIFVPSDRGFALDFIQGICFLSSRFTWKACLSSQLQFVGKNRQCKIVHHGIQRKVFVKGFCMKLLSYSILYYHSSNIWLPYIHNRCYFYSFSSIFFLFFFYFFAIKTHTKHPVQYHWIS